MSAGDVRLALGETHSLLLKHDGSAWSCGLNSDRQLGVNSSMYYSEHFVLAIFSGVKYMSASLCHSIILKDDDTVWGAGKNSYGQLGDGTTSSRQHFSFVQLFRGAKAVAAGGWHSMVLTTTGVVWTTGWNRFGQLGVQEEQDAYDDDNRTQYSLLWQQTAEDVKAIAAGHLHSIVLKNDGTVWSTGKNAHGQLGDGYRYDSGAFVQAVDYEKNTVTAVAVAAGGYHSLVLTQDSRVLATGWNIYGQLGDQTLTVDDRCTYKAVFNGVKAIAAGTRHSMVLTHEGSVWATGYNVHGELGDGSIEMKRAFVRVMPSGVKAIAAGGYHSMLLKEDGTVWATGANDYGQLGDGTTNIRISYVEVANIHRDVSIDPFMVESEATMDDPMDSDSEADSNDPMDIDPAADTVNGYSFREGVFWPQSTPELRNALKECLEVYPDGDCSATPHGPIQKWDVSRLKDLSYSFFQRKYFTGDISRWNVSRATDLSYMFYNAMFFQADISKWDVSRVKDMYSTFQGATSFKGDISRWNVSRVTNMRFMFSDAIIFRGDISKWDVSKVKDTSSMFHGASSFNGNISCWDVSRVENMAWMFSHTKSFNNNISKWDVSSVRSMNSMFFDARSLNSDISKWDVSKVIDMSGIFEKAKSFHGDISKWVVSSVIDMRHLLAYTNFNGVISDWDVSKVTDMTKFFWHAVYFNGDISKWDVSRVVNMFSMFYHASNFNSNISNWDVSSVENMDSMFGWAVRFAGDISKWDISSVKYTSRMFLHAASFKCDISGWNMTNVKHMDFMFHHAQSFEIELCGVGWLDSKATRVGIFDEAFGSIGALDCLAPFSTVPINKPASKRHLIAITTPASMSVIGSMTCPKCGVFKRSGVASCCAPGGAWFENCGGKMDHKWTEGVKACQPRMPDTIAVCSKCGIYKKSGKSSCCSRGGSWFGKCGSAGDSKHEHTWSEGVMACKEWSRSNVASVEKSNGGEDFSLSGNTAVNMSTAETDKIALPTTAYTSTTTALATLATNEATLVTDWVSQDSFKVGVVFFCVMLLLLIALVAVGRVFMRKDASAKEGTPTMLSQSDSDTVKKTSTMIGHFT